MGIRLQGSAIGCSGWKRWGHARSCTGHCTRRTGHTGWRWHDRCYGLTWCCGQDASGLWCTRHANRANRRHWLFVTGTQIPTNSPGQRAQIATTQVWVVGRGRQVPFGSNTSRWIRIAFTGGDGAQTADLKLFAQEEEENKKGSWKNGKEQRLAKDEFEFVQHGEGLAFEMTNVDWGGLERRDFGPRQWTRSVAMGFRA